jgi:ABC-type amino acid transport substrate-binding protein
MSFYPGTRAALPRWDDKPDSIGPGFQVDLEPIAVSDPYYRMEIGLVHRKDVDPGDVRRVADLDGLKLGVEQGTLPGILTLRQGTEAMVRDAKTFNPGPSFLWEMENGAFDAALVTVGAYDFHVRQNPVSKLVLDDYRHPLGFNLGIAVLKENTGLLERLNEVIATLESSGRVEELAAKSKVHFAAPQQPFMQARLTLKDIVNIR